jgi:AbrB family looped-hinge helix DNA binding protein
MPYVVTRKGQVTIPKTIRELLNIHAKYRVEFVQEENQVLLVRIKTSRIFGARFPPKIRCFSPRNVAVRNPPSRGGFERKWRENRRLVW